MFRGNSEKPDARSKVQPRRSLTSVQQQPRLDSADAQTVHYVLKGNVQQTLPLPRSKCIRLVLATSTYADFEAERDCLWREIVPELQQFCLNYGAELFVIDPFQSSDKDLTDDPFLLQTLLTEIDQCRQLSAGLFFICLLGDKYGASSLPIDIRVDEYNHIRTAAFEASKDVRMLDEWYKLDNNSTPPAYTLVSSGTKKKMDAKTRKALIDTVQKGAQQAHNEGLINQVSPKHQERFFCSPIELLVQAALGTNNATKNIFTVMRKFDGMKKEDNQKFPFLDEDHAGSIVKPAERIGNLKNMLTSVCDRNNTESFTVSWPDKMDLTGWLKSKERERYLDQFTHQVTYKLKQLIGNAMTEWSTITYNDLTYDNAYNEGMVHLNWAVESKSNSFVGQAKVLDKIKDLAQAAVKQKGALINIQGGDCWGKTAMLCEVAHHVRNWLTTEPVVVVRFVGLTHSTSFAHEFWKSVCMQICMAYDLDTTTFQRTLRYDSMNKFVAYALEKVSASKQPLVLLIDDVHLMKYGRIFGGGCESDLLPNPLPPNIIIVCTSATGTAQSALPWPAALTSKSTIGLNELGENDLIEIVKNIVSVRGRKLATDQLGIVKQRLSLKNKSNPFIAILLAEEATTWGSHMQPKTASPVKANEKNEKSGAGQSPSAIEARLKQLETEFGLPLLKAIGQYFCVSSHGLTELELLDSLSCNRELLRLIYADADKKTQRSDLVGFPVCTWLAIKKELGVLLKFVIYDNRRIIDWNHASTCNLVRHRYLQNTADIKKCHSDLADLFGDVWSELASTVSMAVKSVKSRKEPVTELHLTQDSTRLLSGNSVGVVSVWDMANGSLIRSYEGHDAEICGIQTVADNSRVLSMDLADNLHVWMLELVEDPDIETTFTFKGPRGLIKLCPNDRDLVARLATNAKEVKIWTLGEETITPRAKIYHNEEITCMSVTSNGRLLVTGSMDQSLKVWDIETGFLTQVLVGHEDAVHCCAIADDERIVVSGAADKMVMIWEVETGDTLHTLGGHKDSTISAVGVTSDGAVAFSADKNGWVQAWDAENGRLLSCFSAHRPVLELVPSFDANRIILRLEACPQLPILCLHNTPAGLLFSQPGPNDARRRSTRTHSISSIGSNYSGSSGHGTMREQQAIGQPVASTSSETRSSPKLPNKTPGKPGPLLKAGKTFDKLERSRSRASLYGDPVSTKISTLPSDGPRPPLATAIAPRGKVQSSNVCTVL
uniref:NWD1/2-like winged helix-turn-helix domain-containing protein n=1 Tax=Plectus sambesii TaxID=2011161 RepID=A0A914UU80_9BILA